MGEGGATGGFQSSIWTDTSLTTDFGGKTGVLMIIGEGGSYRSAPMPTLSYVAARTWTFEWYEEMEGGR